MLGTPQWGIFDQSGSPVLEADSVFSVEYRNDYRISDYPQEQGAFASYNKVKVPWQAKVGYLIQATRQDFLNSVDAAVASLQFYVVATPEVSYPSANLVHYEYRRLAKNGVSMILVEVWLEEVRVVGSTNLLSGSSTIATNGQVNGQDTQSPSGAVAQENGDVQPEATQTSQAPFGTSNQLVQTPFSMLTPELQSAIQNQATTLGSQTVAVQETDANGNTQTVFDTPIPPAP